jgi:signal transduction histidine kinase
VFRDELRTLWAEPRAPGAPARAAGDWVLLAAGLIATALEASLREQVTWRPVSIVLTAGLCLLVLWRRTHPLATVVLAFGGGVLLTLIDVLTGHTQQIGLYSGIIVLVLVHALTRWGSGREIVLGSAVILASFTFSSIVEGGPAGDILGGLSFLMFPAALGGFLRLRTMSRRRELEEMRAGERESIARELHDTVAHHVSAIVVRAQAGRVLADLDPSTAAETLAGVEEEGARTLEAMRAMVKALRTAETDAELTPLPGTADLRRLARDRPGDGSVGVPIRLRVDGSAESLPPAVDTAVYRIVQESVTNATRHATGATEVEVRVTIEPGQVRIAVRDDGAVAGRGPRRSGFGLTGLRERAALLGGDLRAGPCHDGGWLVEAELPLSGLRGPSLEEARGNVHPRAHR